MNEIKYQNINRQTINNFLRDYSMFYQRFENNTGQQIITKQDLRDKLRNNVIKDAYIITIIEDNINSFKIDVRSLNNKLDIEQFMETINLLETSVKKLMEDDCYKIDYEIKQQTDLKDMQDNYKYLEQIHDKYKKTFNKIKDENKEKINRANIILQEKINKIKEKINFSKHYTINEQLNIKENLKFKENENEYEVLLGNKNLLKFIKTAIKKEVKLGSMIFKLHNKNIEKNEENHHILIFGENIDYLTPYSYNDTYLLLGSVINY